MTLFFITQKQEEVQSLGSFYEAVEGNPIIAGGLISDKESVVAALSAGAIAVSSTNHGVWEM